MAAKGSGGYRRLVRHGVLRRAIWVAALVPALATAAMAGAGEREPSAKGPTHDDVGAGPNEGAECVRGAPEPIVAERVSGSSHRRSFQKIGPNDAVERLTLDRATDLTVHQLGCAHYGVKWTFTLKRERLGSRNASGWLVEAADLLDRVPVVEAQRAAVRTMVESLRKGASETSRLGEPLRISETETVSVTARKASPGVQLTVLADVAL